MIDRRKYPIVLSYLILVWIVLFTFKVNGQTDTILHLPQVEIIEKSVRNEAVGKQVENWDSLHLHPRGSQNVADLLSNESTVFIKSNGLGGLATSSVRGGAGGHTAVLWNDFSIQSPMLGLLDLSLLPISFVEEVDLSLGGSSVLWGSGGIGGAISLKNKSHFEKRTSVQLQSNFGSFGHWNEQLKVTFGNNKFQSITRLFYQEAENDFPYQIREDLPVKHQTNAALQQGGVLQSFAYRINTKQSINAHFWWQKTERGIPPLTTQNESLARQEDEVYRAAIDWKRVGNGLVLQARTAIFQEDNYYEDEIIQLENLNTFWTSISEFEGDWYLNEKSKLYFGSNFTFTKAETGNYSEEIGQKRFAIFTAFQQEIKNWKGRLHLRQEWVEGQSSVFVPALSIESNPNKQVFLKAQVSRNYRLPTLNDLYWNPGGNPDLRSEIGWSEEIGLHFQPQIKPLKKASFSLTGFNRQINDWILWATKPGEFFYSAQNIAAVWSRGMEQRLNILCVKKNFELQIKEGFDYTLSTNESETPSLFEKGEQLIYTPKYQFFGSLGLAYKGFRFQYRHQFVGKTKSINEDLEAYHIGNINLAKDFEKGAFFAQIFLEINNVWDEQYRVVERRPMPGRNFRLGLNFVFTK